VQNNCDLSSQSQLFHDLVGQQDHSGKINPRLSHQLWDLW